MKPANKTNYKLRDDGVLVRIRYKRELEAIIKEYNPYTNFKIQSLACMHVVGDNGDIYPKPHGYELKPGETKFASQGSSVVYMRKR